MDRQQGAIAEGNELALVGDPQGQRRYELTRIVSRVIALQRDGLRGRICSAL